MAEVALAEKPLDVTVGCGSDAFAAERRPLVPVAGTVGLVTLLAMIAIKERTGFGRLGVGGQRTHMRVILGRDLIQARTRRRQNREGCTQRKATGGQNASDHCALPFQSRNQLEICGTS